MIHIAGPSQMGLRLNDDDDDDKNQNQLGALQQLFFGQLSQKHEWSLTRENVLWTPTKMVICVPF